MEKPVERPAEKRFDVRVPVANTELLELLTLESEKTGIAEARLIVLYATERAQQKRGLVPLPGVVPTFQMAPPQSCGIDGSLQQRDGELPAQPTLSASQIDSFFGDPD